MSNIMLAKDHGKQPKSKQIFPALVSEKLDGVASIFTVEADGTVSIDSRQNKPIVSCQHIQDKLATYNLPVGAIICGELHIPGMSFKKSAGIIRRHKPDTRICLGIYDYWSPEYPNSDYALRIIFIDVRIQNKNIFTIPFKSIRSDEELQKVYAECTKDPKAEGIMIRPVDHKFQPGKRSWDMLRWKRLSTEDLEVVGYEEAISKDGDPKGMVGRINVLYKGKVIGAGAGKLKHAERVKLWNEPFVSRIAEIAYKPDESYEALREARFYRWREDK